MELWKKSDFMNTKKEIQERVEFKMNELLTGLRNRASVNWNIAFVEGSQKHQHYWEAFGQMAEMLKKEMMMDVPRDEMFETKKRALKDKAVEKISSSILKPGESGYRNKINVIVSAVEQAQRF